MRSTKWECMDTNKKGRTQILKGRTHGFAPTLCIIECFVLGVGGLFCAKHKMGMYGHKQKRANTIIEREEHKYYKGEHKVRPYNP